MNGYKNLNDALEEYAKYVIQQARTNLTKDKKGDGNLYNSLSYDILESTDEFLVDFLMEDYGMFVDKGVKGKQAPILKHRQHYLNFNMVVVQDQKVA